MTTATRTPTRPPSPGLLLALIVVLNAVGVLMVLSASSVYALQAYGSSWVLFGRHLLWLAIAVGAFAVTARMDYRAWSRLAAPLLAVSVGLLVLVLVPGIGTHVNGSSRWLRAGWFGVQPSEVAKLALVVFTATLLARRADRMGDTRATVRPVLVVTGGLALLIMLQPDMGTTMVLACVAVSVLFVAGAPLRTLAVVTGAGSVLALLVARGEPYRWARMVSFRDPFADAGNSGYQLVQSLVGLGSGNITGLGLGASRAKWGFLPNAHTDFIFAVIGEELGLLGSLLVLALFVAFAVVGVRTALRAPDRLGTLLAAGITAWVAGQALINIGVVVGLLPVTGVPLPFVSSGGSSLVITMAACGILVNIARTGAGASRRRTVG